MPESLNGPEIMCNREAMYDGWETYYRDSEGDTAWGDRAPPFLRDVLGDHLGECNSVVDFGAGDGRNSLALGLLGHRLTLVDISKGGLAKAALRATKMGLRPIPTLVLAGLEDLPLGQDQFDFAICIDTLPQVRRPRLALEQMAGTLLPGGTLVVNVFTSADCAFGEGERLTNRSFLYKSTLFNFFEDSEFRPLIDGLFEMKECRQVAWTDPPHIPFRPFEHTHNALVYVLVKK